MNVETKCCDCGKWQDMGYPCIHSVAYFKEYRKSTCDEMLQEVEDFYTYESEKNIFGKNFKTVCIDSLKRDGETRPPNFRKRKSAGRPRKRRLRKRIRHVPLLRENKCRHCGSTGHNVRTSKASKNIIIY
ncbi:MAG: SWIM zinc finger family protein [Holophagaceae bacterium]